MINFYEIYIRLLISVYAGKNIFVISSLFILNK